LDGYAKRHHNCHITEFWFEEEKSQLTVCVRPLGDVFFFGDRYACRYLQIEVAEAYEMIRCGLLPSSIASYSDDQLQPLALVK
jgi:hypothetical protein